MPKLKTHLSFSENELLSDFYITGAGTDFDKNCSDDIDSNDEPEISTGIRTEEGEVLEQISSESDEEETWSAFFLSILLAQAKRPELKYMILSLYFATTLYGASAGWFGPQATLEELYGVENDFAKNYTDASCVELNTLLRFFYLFQTLKLMNNALAGLESLGWLDWFIIPMAVSVTGGDTCLSTLAGTAAQHWGPLRLNSVAAITATELLFLNFRNVTQTYKLLFRKFHHAEQDQLLTYIGAIRLYLYTLPPSERLQNFKDLLKIPEELNTEKEIMNYLINENNRQEIMVHAKQACDDLNLISEGKLVTGTSVSAIAYALIGGVIASYEWMDYLNKQGSFYSTTGLAGIYSIIAKTCGYSIALFTLIDLVINRELLLNGARQTGSQNNWYLLAVATAIICFIATVPPSGLSFLLPTNAVLNFLFPNWVKEGGMAYQIILPLLGAMGSCANSIGYNGMCKILLDNFRKEIDAKTLQGDIDICKLLDDLETHILRRTAPDKQSIVFLLEVIYSLIRTTTGTAEHGNHISYLETHHYISAREPDHPDHVVVQVEPRSHYVPAVPYDSDNSSNFFRTPRNYGSLQSATHHTLSLN